MSMTINVSPRASGKTTKMIEWLKENPDGLLLVINRREQERLQGLYSELKHRIVNWEEYLDHKYKYRALNQIAIDNADNIFERLFSKRVTYFSMTEMTEAQKQQSDELLNQKHTTVMDLMVAIADGNPGAATVLKQIHQKVDEGTFYMVLMSLNFEGIMGSKLWMLYKDKHEEDIDKTIEDILSTHL